MRFSETKKKGVTKMKTSLVIVDGFQIVTELTEQEVEALRNDGNTVKER